MSEISRLTAARRRAADAVFPGCWKVLLAFTAVYLVWGSTYLAIRFAIETLPPFLMTGVRFLVAGGLLYGWARLRGLAAPARRYWGSAVVVGTLLLLGGNGGVVWAEQFVSSGLAALVVSTVPLWVVVLGWLGPRAVRAGKPGRPVAVGVLAGFAGVAFLVGPGKLAAGGGVPLFPAAVLVGAAFSWALGSLLSRRLPLPSSPMLATAMEMLGGGAVLLAVSVAAGEPARLELAAVSARSWLALAYLVVFGSLIAFSAYIYLLTEVAPAKAATYAYVNPVVALLLGWALADEPLTTRTLVSAAVILGAVVVITTYRRREPPPAPDLAPEPAPQPEPAASLASPQPCR